MDKKISEFIEVTDVGDNAVIPVVQGNPLNNYKISVENLLKLIKIPDFSKEFLSKISDDIAEGFIEFLKGISVEELATFVQGLEVGNYTPGLLGSGAALKMKDGISELEVDKLTVRMIATFFEIVVSKLRHINGGIVLSRGSMTCSRVVEDVDSYQCFFERGDNNEISNTFVVNDQARCQVFNGGNQKFYWRLVTEVGEDWIKLSKTVGIGDSIPEVGDDVVQLGYQGKDLNHVKRLNAQIIDESGISQYAEIDDFTLEGKRRNFISADGTGSEFTGKVSFKNAGVDYDLSDWAHETETAIDKAQSDANTSLAKTKFMTEIDGGLIYSAMMKLYDAGDTGDEMAGISGIAGENKEDPAFWAGGTYDQAIGGTAKAIIRHDGSSKFTDTEIEGKITALEGEFSGIIRTKNPAFPKAIIEIDGESNSMSVKDAQGKVKVLISPTEIGNIDDYFSDSVTRSFYGQIGLSESGRSRKNVFTPTGTIYAVKGDVFQISYDSLSIYARVWNRKPDGTSWEPIRVEVTALLRINEESFTLGSVWASTSTGGSIDDDTVDIKEGSIIYTAKSSGNLQFRLQGAYLPSIPDSIGEDYSVYGDTRFEDGNLLKVEKVVNRSQIGIDGMMIANSKTSYTYMGQPVFETRRGNKGIRITSDGYFKLNSSGQWVEWNI